jgi:hypothetical protein
MIEITAKKKLLNLLLLAAMKTNKNAIAKRRDEKLSAKNCILK